jgi:hypothetical protein
MAKPCALPSLTRAQDEIKQQRQYKQKLLGTPPLSFKLFSYARTLMSVLLSSPLPSPPSSLPI